MSDNEFTSTLLRKNSLRKATQGVSVADLEKVLADLQEIKEEKVAEEKERAAADASRLEAVKKIKAQMAELGLSAEDISSGSPATATKKASVPAKYRLIDADGQPHEWSGRGRTPRVYLERFEKGAKKEDFLIHN